MSNGFTSEKRVTTTVLTEGVYRVPAPKDEGADYGVVSAAAATAWTEYREQTGTAEGEQMPPGVLRFEPGDRQIVISWAVEEVTT